MDQKDEKPTKEPKENNQEKVEHGHLLTSSAFHPSHPPSSREAQEKEDKLREYSSKITQEHIEALRTFDFLMRKTQT